MDYEKLEITTIFKEGDMIPIEYTRYGKNVSPEFYLKNVSPKVLLSF